MYSFDNYKILEWDENEKKLKITSSSSEEILNLWNIKDNTEKNLRNEEKKNVGKDKAEQLKNETKEVEDKFDGMKMSKEINLEANLKEKLKKKFEEELIKQNKEKDIIIEKLIEENNALKKELLEKNSIIEENRYYLNEQIY